MFVASAIVGCGPFLVLHLRSLWAQQQYQFFPFVIGAVVVLLWTRIRDVGEGGVVFAPSGLWLPRLSVMMALILLLGAVILVSAWLAAVAAVVLSAAMFWSIGSRRPVKYLWGIWSLLWLTIPAPLGQDANFTRQMQRISSQISSRVLDLFQVEHVMDGNVLELASRQFFVDEACSGMISIMSVVACGAIYGVWVNRRPLHIVALVFCGICWAVAINVGRISVIAVVYEWWHVDWSTGAVHELLGLALFMLTFGALLSTDRLLQFMLAPIPVLSPEGIPWVIRCWNKLTMLGDQLVGLRTGVDREDIGSQETGAAKVAGNADGHRPALNRWWPIAAAVSFFVLGAIQAAVLMDGTSVHSVEVVAHANTIDASVLPEKVGPWKRVDFQLQEREAYSEFGKYSRSYTYEHSTTRDLAIVSLDYPYLGGWHDLCVCYRNAGWQVRRRDVLSHLENGWKYVEGELEPPEGDRGLLLFAGFDGEGNPAEPASSFVMWRPWFRLRRRLYLNVSPQLFQVQLMIQSRNALTDSVHTDVDKLFVVSRQRFRDYIATQE